MIVSLSGNKIVWYEFLALELQEKIRQEIEAKYPPSRLRRNAYEVDDNSAMGQLLSAINYLVDLHGAKAIDWINENGLSGLSIKNLKGITPEPKQRTKHPMEFYENALIRFGDGNFIELKNNPNIEISYTNPSYLAAKEFALKYLKENNANRRLYISSCKEWNVCVVWAKKCD